MADAAGSRLLIIGGAERRGTTILARFVELAGGPDAHIVVIAAASAVPGELEADYAAAFTGLGAGTVRALRLTTREDAGQPSALAALEQATAVFFTGGDQYRITTLLGGTPVDSLLQTLVADGRLVLAGTSAGAAMMSGTMILGGNAPGVTTTSVRTGPGLEFLPGVLIDMHFAERGRLNRLLSAVAMYPHEVGVGIDEDTAILARQGAFQVLGSGSVTVVDAGAASDIRVPADGPIAIAGARIHVLPAGYTFHLKDREWGRAA
ncbi:cyanophycinase [Mangrovihabitans endophyticus]|uniref:Cyanophycinase n=1 Tax=Mangrovihabitans endophyticus TaxID=1751298 RepID=A0A8J3FP04_9ACTN|nr:cyanophycinase [Mangrovihabitans endophyticus]GGK85747.1 cyanophycinase [Mangrovihabitans endophyticus]